MFTLTASNSHALKQPNTTIRGFLHSVNLIHTLIHTIFYIHTTKRS
jgi:hypothetical protein